MATINRGFGGSQICDSTEFADRIVIKYKPGLIVFYAGDNDINAGKSAEQVHVDFTAFVAKVRESLPKAPILFISIKPSIARWAKRDVMRGGQSADRGGHRQGRDAEVSRRVARHAGSRRRAEEGNPPRRWAAHERGGIRVVERAGAAANQSGRIRKND